MLIRAKYLIENPQVVVEDGAVAVEGSRVTFVGKFHHVEKEASGPVKDLGEVAIIPGLINSHTHLELSVLEGKLKPTKDFTGWVTRIVMYRTQWDDVDFTTSVEKGAHQALASGTTTVADITSGHSLEALRDIPIRRRLFQEVISLDPDMAEDIISQVEERFNAAYLDELTSLGLSPHAPYTVSEALFKSCAQLARKSGLPLATHVAETMDEVEFLTRGTGKFATMLKMYGMLGEHWRPPGSRPIEYLKTTGILQTAPLLIHCNYLSEGEISSIKEHGAKVCFCPRSHRFFGHENHPVKELLKAGITVALGTDSLASNSSLSMLDEMRFFLEQYKGLSPQEVLAMVTTRAARALGLENLVGRLEKGLAADLAVIETPKTTPDALYENLLHPQSKNILTMVAGRVGFDERNLLGTKA